MHSFRAIRSIDQTKKFSSQRNPCYSAELRTTVAPFATYTRVAHECDEKLSLVHTLKLKVKFFIENDHNQDGFEIQLNRVENLIMPRPKISNSFVLFSWTVFCLFRFKQNINENRGKIWSSLSHDVSFLSSLQYRIWFVERVWVENCLRIKVKLASCCVEYLKKIDRSTIKQFWVFERNLLLRLATES